jgi:hypothetical protein
MAYEKLTAVHSHCAARQVYTNKTEDQHRYYQSHPQDKIFSYIHIHQITPNFKMNIFPNDNKQDAAFLDLFISTDALHVSGGSSAHHQEHKNVHTASGIVNQYCCWLLSWMRWNAVPSYPR